MERLPMLWVSSFLEQADDPLDEGREVLLRIKERRPPEFSRLGLLGLLGDFAAVRGEKPLGGFEVRMTGGQAASSSRDTGSCLSSSRLGW
jgi:hypothetical protein